MINQADDKLDLIQVVKWLIEDQIIEKDKLDLIKRLNSNHLVTEKLTHPFQYIIQRQWTDRNSKIITYDDLMNWLSKRTQLDYVQIDPLTTDVAKITGIISISYAQFFNILPLSIDSQQIIVATAQPFQLDWKKEVARISKRKIKLVLARPDEISRYIEEFFQVAKTVYGASTHEAELRTADHNFEQLVELGKKGQLDSNDHHIINLVDWLLQYAFEQRASDIHLEPRRDQANVRFRIDGKMQKVYEIPSLVMSAVSSRLKILARMNVAEKRRPQDGRIKTRDPQLQEIELRLSTMPTAFGEKLVMRIFNPQVLKLSYLELGFTPQNEQIWHQLIQQRNGLILVTGPTGSGKTSTLYTSLRELAKPDVNVCTVEDPIEMVEPKFNQMQVQDKINLSFADGIRTLLRQDPDIIMVGEIRDLETAEMAIQASLTGHLVLSTLHTNDSASAIIRLLDLGIAHYLIQSSLLGIMAQRLVRTLCPECKQEQAVDEDIWHDFVGDYQIKTPDKLFIASGCQSCRYTGYSGRTGIYEILSIDRELKHLINENTSLDLLHKTISKKHIEDLKLSGIKKVTQGLTTMQEILKVTG